MSEEIIEILHGDNNGNDKKDAVSTTSRKRTPLKRASFIERAQKESEELIKNMGLDLDIGGGRKTRSSTRGNSNRNPVEKTPTPSKKQKTEVTPSSRRGRPKRIEHLLEPESEQNNDDIDNANTIVKNNDTTIIDNVEDENETDKSTIVEKKVQSNDISKDVKENEELTTVEDEIDANDLITENENVIMNDEKLPTVQEKISLTDDLSEENVDTQKSDNLIVIEDKVDSNEELSEDTTVTNPDNLIIVEDKTDSIVDLSEDVIDITKADSKEELNAQPMDVDEVTNVKQSTKIININEDKNNSESTLQNCDNEKESPIVELIELDGSVDSKSREESTSPKKSIVYEVLNSDSSNSSIEIISSEPASTPSKEAEKEIDTTTVEVISAVNNTSSGDNCESKLSSSPAASQENLSTP